MLGVKKKTRIILLPCGEKNFDTVGHLVTIQQCDRQMDRQNCSSR